MSRTYKWLLPATAALALLVGFSAFSSAADDAKTGKGTVAGTVVDKDGKGVAGVEVHLMKPFRRGGGPGGPGGRGPGAPAPSGQAALDHAAVPLQQQDNPRPRPTPIATATTDNDGKFTMTDVPAGDYMIGVRDEDKKVFGRARVTVEDGKTANVEIKTSDTPPARGPGGPGGPGGRRGGQAPQQ